MSVVACKCGSPCDSRYISDERVVRERVGAGKWVGIRVPGCVDHDLEPISSEIAVVIVYKISRYHATGH